MVTGITAYKRMPLLYRIIKNGMDVHSKNCTLCVMESGIRVEDRIFENIKMAVDYIKISGCSVKILNSSENPMILIISNAVMKQGARVFFVQSTDCGRS